MIIVHSWDKVDLSMSYLRNGSKVGAEIGVYNGVFSKSLYKLIPELKMYLVDPYKYWEEGYVDSLSEESQAVQDKRYEMVKELYSDLDAEILRMTSKEALSCIEDESLDFVYIDANHSYEHFSSDLEEWSKKVKEGGIVSGHDFSLLFPDICKRLNEVSDDKEIHVCGHDSNWFFLKGNKSDT